MIESGFLKLLEGGEVEKCLASIRERVYPAQKPKTNAKKDNLV